MCVLIQIARCFFSDHITQSLFNHSPLLEQMVDRYFTLGVVVHRALEEEAEEALYAVTACASRPMRSTVPTRCGDSS